MRTISRHEVARIVWEASRADEGTISATGANIVADALLPPLEGALSDAWEAGYRHGRGKVDQAQVDLHNPYKREATSGGAA